MKRKVAKAVLVFLLIHSLACKDESLRKSARASDDMASTIAVAIEAKRGLAQQNLITPDEELTVTIALKKANDAVIQFNTRAEALQQLDPNSKTELLRLFENLSGAVKELNEQGVLAIKNPASQGKLKVILSALDTSLTVIRTALGGY